MITCNFQGDKEIIEKLYSLGKIGTSVVRKQLTVSAKKMKDAIKYFTPVHTGALKKSISTHAQIAKDRSYLYTSIGVKSDYKNIKGRHPVKYSAKVEQKTKFSFRVFRNMYKYTIDDFTNSIREKINEII